MIDVSVFCLSLSLPLSFSGACKRITTPQIHVRTRQSQRPQAHSWPCKQWLQTVLSRKFHGPPGSPPWVLYLAVCTAAQAAVSTTHAHKNTHRAHIVWTCCLSHSRGRWKLEAVVFSPPSSGPWSWWLTKIEKEEEVWVCYVAWPEVDLPHHLSKYFDADDGLLMINAALVSISKKGKLQTEKCAPPSSS